MTDGNISQITLPNGSTYEIKDEIARLFIINLTYDDEEDVVVADKTFSEIGEAYSNGSNIIVRYDYSNYTLCEVEEDNCFTFCSIHNTSVAHEIEPHKIEIFWLVVDSSDTWEGFSSDSLQIFSVPYNSNFVTFSQLKNALNEGMKLICYDHSSTKALSYNNTVYAWLERYKTDDYFIFTRVNEDGEIISYTYNSSNQWSRTTISNSPPTLTATYTAATYDLEIDLSSAIDADDTEY